MYRMSGSLGHKKCSMLTISGEGNEISKAFMWRYLVSNWIHRTGVRRGKGGGNIDCDLMSLNMWEPRRGCIMRGEESIRTDYWGTLAFMRWGEQQYCTNTFEGKPIDR